MRAALRTLGRASAPALATAALVACAPEAEPGPPEGAPAPSLVDWARESARAADDLEPLTRRRLRVEARVVFADRPEVPHRLIATWDGARARAELALEADAQTPRAFEHLVAGRAFVRPAGSLESVELTGDEWTGLARRFAARRALWTSADPDTSELERVPLPRGARLELDRSDDEQERWNLRGPEGETIEHWTVLARDPGDGRPTRVVWGGPEGPIWTAERLALETDGRFAERYFWPPDRWEEHAPVDRE